MTASLNSLKNVLGLRSGASLEQDLPWHNDVSPTAILPWLAPSRVHEFADDSTPTGDWQPPLTLLAGLAGELPFDGSIVWVGRRCWPTFQFFQKEGQDAKHLLARHLFLDPLSDAERLWGITEVSRSSAVRVVIADGSGFNATAGRKVQLAAEKGNAVVLLARPASDFLQPSWATTRWCVSPLESQTGSPRWKVSLTRVTGTRQGQDASRHWIVSWTYEVFRGAGTFDLFANVGCGTGATATETDAAHRQSARKPVAPPLLLTVESAGHERVARCCPRALSLGVARGMSLAEARALCPTARMLRFDEAHSRKCLALFAEWAMRFSPKVAIDPHTAGEFLPSPDGLLLDVTGTAHLFGGEQMFLAEVAARLNRVGFSVRAAIAPTIGAAWAIARYGRSALSIVSEQSLAAALDPLPVAALRIEPSACVALADIGVVTVEALRRIPRESLQARFGEDVLWRMDQAYGRINERIEPIRPLEELAVQRLFDGATTQLEAVFLTVQELLAELSALLLARESGVRGLLLVLDRINDPPASLSIMLGHASRDVKHLWSLLRPKVEGMHLGHGVEAVTLTATWIERIRHDQSSMWRSAEGEHEQAMAELLDTLVNRWGMQRVLAPVPAASHVPERAYQLVPVTEVSERGKEPAAPIIWADRPSKLLEKVEPAEAVALLPDHPPRWLRWRGDEYMVVAGMGPERIVAAPGRTRDYFKVEIEGGRWLWVYREFESGRWFVHGVWA